MLNWFRKHAFESVPCAHEAEIELLHQTIAEYQERLAYYEKLHPELAKLRNLILDAHDLATQAASRVCDANEQAMLVQKMMGFNAANITKDIVAPVSAPVGANAE